MSLDTCSRRTSFILGIAVAIMVQESIKKGAGQIIINSITWSHEDLDEDSIMSSIVSSIVSLLLLLLWKVQVVKDVRGTKDKHCLLSGLEEEEEEVYSTEVWSFLTTTSGCSE